MRIKIISGKGMWYEKYIGRTYHVKRITFTKLGKYYVIRNYQTILRTVNFEDAIEVGGMMDANFIHGQSDND